jgi:hypothetical protein
MFDEIYFSGASSLASTLQKGTQSFAKAGKMAKLGATADVVSTVVGIGSGIASTIASVSDAKKRAEFQENLEKLSLQQQGELEKDIQRAKTVTERIGILTNAVAMIRVAEVNKKLEKKPQNDTKQLLFIIGGGFAVLLGVVIIKLMIRK